MLCITLPGPIWSSESLKSRALPPSTLQAVEEATLLFESWQAALEGIELYERVGTTMLQSPAAYESSFDSSESYTVCSKHTEQAIEDIEASLEHLEEARRMLDTWIEANGGYSVPMDIAQHELMRRGG